VLLFLLLLLPLLLPMMVDVQQQMHHAPLAADLASLLLLVSVAAYH
jgi:hypothetical protein